MFQKVGAAGELSEFSEPEYSFPLSFA